MDQIKRVSHHVKGHNLDFYNSEVTSMDLLVYSITLGHTIYLQLL